ncbi:MAG: glutamyl-tRNA reductase [Bryobacteraceae bacterium]|nr:glutamyl-tRNA reductase [Bryobacteraceae bacterium]
MKVLLTGLSHHTAPVEVREKLAFPEADLPGALEELRSHAGAHEALILSTCNRVEIAVTAESESAAERVSEFLASRQRLDPAWLKGFLYRHEDRDAIRHLFRVAASLDSMVVGEPQILGQLKSAYHTAREHGSINGFLDAVLTRAFAVAKRVRSETGIARSAVSVSSAAVDLARQIFGNLRDKRVLLIGAGKMSELAARHLLTAGCGLILVTNRTRERAEQMALAIGAQVLKYETFHERLHEIDIVITSSGAPDYLLRKDEMQRVLERRRNRPMFVIDIAVPRNVAPEVNELENIYLYDIDDLGQTVEQNRRARAVEAEQAEEIIDAEIARLLERLKAREVTPTIVGIQHQLDAFSRAELERLRPRFGELSPHQEEALQAYTRALLNKIAHGPMTELRRASTRPEGDKVINVIRRVFRLDAPPDQDE